MRLEHKERFERKIAFEKRKRARKEAKAARAKKKAHSYAATGPGGSKTIGHATSNGGRSGGNHAQATLSRSDLEEFEMSDTEWEGEVAYMERMEAEWAADGNVRISNERADEIFNTLKYSQQYRCWQEKYFKKYAAKMAED
jgi:hypothetical protein